MICRTCGKAIPDGKLACVACLNAHYEREILAHQLPFLKNVRDGRQTLMIARSHVIRFGDRRRSLCGHDILGPIRSFPLVALQNTYICPDCRKVLDGLLEQVAV